jgi:hypothetical protein
MIDIRSISPLSATQLDRAPKTASRAEPEDVPTTKLGVEAPHPERRRNPDRRRRRAKETIDRRLGADRRRRSVDIEV